MRPVHRPLAALALASVLAACATTGPSPSEPTRARALRPQDEEVPAAIKSIETQIDRRAAIVADEVEIHCSKNYEWDVALTGDEVTPQRAQGGEHVSIAEGSARATFRNLEIRAHRRIVFRRSGLDVVPFIRVAARGNAAHAVVPPQGGEPAVKRARLIRIEDAKVQYIDEDPAGS